MKNKRSFMLLEIIMSFVLISSVLIPMVYFYSSSQRESMLLMHEIQLPHVVDACFSHVIKEARERFNAPTDVDQVLKNCSLDSVCTYSYRGEPKTVFYGSSVSLQKGFSKEDPLVEITIYISMNKKRDVFKRIVRL